MVLAKETRFLQKFRVSGFFGSERNPVFTEIPGFWVLQELPGFWVRIKERSPKQSTFSAQRRAMAPTYFTAETGAKLAAASLIGDNNFPGKPNILREVISLPPATGP